MEDVNPTFFGKVYRLLRLVDDIPVNNFLYNFDELMIDMPAPKTLAEKRLEDTIEKYDKKLTMYAICEGHDIDPEYKVHDKKSFSKESKKLLRGMKSIVENLSGEDITGKMDSLMLNMVEYKDDASVSEFKLIYDICLSDAEKQVYSHSYEELKNI